MADSSEKTKIKTNLHPPANWIRFIAVIFGALLCYGALQKLTAVNMALSLDHWGNFMTGLLLIVTPFVMNYFLPSVLLSTGVYTVIHLFHSNLQNWMNLVLFVLLTVLLMQPYPKWLRTVLKLAILVVTGICLACVWSDFYQGLAHFIEAGKLTDEYLKNRLMVYLPNDFSFYMAVLALAFSIRQYMLPKEKNPKTQHTHRRHQNDKDLWGY